MSNRFAVVAMLSLLPAWGSAKAGLIVYTESVTGASGFLGNNSFSNSLVTLTSFTDTADVTMQPGFYQAIGPTTVTVASLGTTANVITDFVGVISYTDPFPILDNKYLVIFEDDSQSALILGTESYDFAGYDLTTSIGPITGNSDISVVNVPTDQGGFILQSGGDATFTAILLPTAAPEPASFILAGLGLAGLLWRALTPSRAPTRSLRRAR
jgi:PEP-CTERM motif